jgi:hypothetical protein
MALAPNRRLAASGFLQIAGSRATALFDYVKADALAVIQSGHTSFFYGTDVYKHIFAAIFGLDETETFLRIKKFNCTDSHFWPPGIDSVHAQIGRGFEQP